MSTRSEDQFPSELVRMVKRSEAYRRFRCHLSDVCPEDVWADGPRLAFVVFGLDAQTAAGTHIGFALDRKSGEVTRVRVLRMAPDQVQGRDIGLLKPCGEQRMAPRQPVDRLAQPSGSLVTM